VKLGDSQISLQVGPIGLEEEMANPKSCLDRPVRAKLQKTKVVKGRKIHPRHGLFPIGLLVALLLGVALIQRSDVGLFLRVDPVTSCECRLGGVPSVLGKKRRRPALLARTRYEAPQQFEWPVNEAGIALLTRYDGDNVSHLNGVQDRIFLG
jgi:hypothetical protein